MGRRAVNEAIEGHRETHTQLTFRPINPPCPYKSYAQRTSDLEAKKNKTGKSRKNLARVHVDPPTEVYNERTLQEKWGNDSC